MDTKLIREKVSEGYIHISAIIEMVGKPKEHVDKTLRDYMKTIPEQKDIELVKEDYSEPKQIEGEMFSAFVEVEVLTKGAEKLFDFCFDFMPSSIEIISPESIRYSSQRFTGFLNDLQSRLHELDMTVKRVNETNKQLNRNTENLLKNSIKLAIKSGNSKLSDISKNLGIAEENLSKIMDTLVETNLLKKEGDSYKLN